MVTEEEQSNMELDSERIPVPQMQNIEATSKTCTIPRIKPRLRKKALHAAILKQMEFYFGDANLNKDRFLANLIKNDPYVDLGIFIRFNKIRELTTDINRIAKALQMSTMLQVSEDGTKVRRTTPIQQKEDIDRCTIYVQNVPPDADHDWLISTFSRYGDVAYVSLPRYKSSKKIKGFAFVEFDTPETANKCLKVFQERGCVLPSSISPDEVLSITTFDNTEKDVTGGLLKPDCIDIKREGPQEEDDIKIEVKEDSKEEIIEEIQDPENQKESKKNKKRKHNEVDNFDESFDMEDKGNSSVQKNERKKKRKYPNQSEEENITSDQNNLIDDKSNLCKEPDTLSDSSEIPNKRDDEEVHSETEIAADIATEDSSEIPIQCKHPNSQLVTNDINKIKTDENNSEEITIKRKKKKRVRKRKNKIEDINYYVGLQIMAKTDWKHLRNKYLELQRCKMKQLKQHLRKTRRNQWCNQDRNKPKEEIYDTENEDINKSGVSFVPGVIVKIDMDECCVDPKAFKAELKGSSFIKYIDVSEGTYQAYVRCDTPQSAQSLVQKSNEKRQITILEGEEERMYWKKIAQDREDKLSKKFKVKQRGRDKLLKKAEKELGKHIKFDEVN